MNLLLIAFSALIATVFAWYLTRYSLAYALHRQIVDLPTQRSSHGAPTPRGGGSAFALVFSGTVLLLGVLHLLQPLETAGLLCGLLIAVIGFWDDCVSLSIHLRLFVQLAATAAALYCLLGTEWLHRVFGDSRLGPLAVVLLWLGFVWLVNLTNFMDGIDGLAATEAITVAVCCGALSLLAHGPSVVALLYSVLAAAVLGFLIWNWFPAKIFMGDVGSCFLGYSFGALTLLGIVRHRLSPFVPLILLGVFIIDASLTLAKRVIRGDRWLQPHRTHAFQHLSCRLGHERTTLTIAAVNVLWLLPWAAVAQRHPSWELGCLLAAWLPIVAAAQRLRAGERDATFDGLAWTDLAHYKATRLVGVAGLGRTSGATLILLYRAMENNGSAVKYFALATLNFAAVYAALLTRFDGHIPSALLQSMPTFALLWTVVQTAVLMLFNTSRSRWRFTSVEEIPKVSAIATLASITGAVVVYFASGTFGYALPRSIDALDALYSVAVLTGLHFLARLMFVYAHRLARGDKRRRVLIYGANETGMAILSDLRCYCPGYRAVGFVDERPRIKGATFSGLRVLGSDQAIAELARKHRIDLVVFPSAILEQRSAVVHRCIEQKIDFRLVSTISEEQLSDLAPSHVIPIAS